MLKCGSAKIEITPRLGVELCGYGYFLERYANRVEKPLWARALAFDSDGARALIISCDLIGFDKSFSEKFRLSVSQKHGTTLNSVFLCATHTHCGPATCTLYGLGKIDDVYMAELYEKLITAADAAFEDLDEVTGYKSGSAPVMPLGFNRTGYSDITDNLVKGFTLERSTKKPIAAISYGCHPVTLGRLDAYSPDYPEKACLELENKGFESIFLAGMQGDIDPMQNKIAWGTGTDEIISEYGKRLSDGLFSKLEKKNEQSTPEVALYHLSYILDLQHIGEDNFAVAQTKYSRDDHRFDGINRTTDKWVENMRKKLASDENPFNETFDVYIFKLGDVLLVGFPHEVFTFPQIMLKHYFPHYTVICMGNVNYTNRYFPTSEDIIQGGYAGAGSHIFYMTFPVIEGELERVTLELIQDLKNLLK